MIEPITSRSNPRIRAVAALRDRRERERTGLTIVDGAREVRRAVKAGVAVAEAYVCPALVRTDDARDAVAALEARGAFPVEVAEAPFERLAFGGRSEGIVAVVRIPSLALERIPLGPDSLVVVLEAVEKPGNLGAVLRSADGAGASALVAADPRTDLFNPNAIRASLGTIFSVPLGAAPSGDVRGWLEANGLRIVVARVDGSFPYDTLDLTGGVALVLGSEAVGVSDAWAGPGVAAARLPMLGVADSLNVSTAAAVLLYESRRQRDRAARGDG